MGCNNNWLYAPTDSRGYASTTKYKIPCGWCMGCRMATRQMWQDRLEMESLKYDSFTFLTLTYDEEHIPIGSEDFTHKFNLAMGAEPSLNYNDTNKFIKRLRYYTNKGVKQTESKKWKYYLVGEMGGLFQRPHYHMIIEGLDFMLSKKLFNEAWGLGIIKSLPILEGGIRYVLSYIDSEQKGEQKKIKFLAMHAEPPKATRSTGIGRDFFYANKEEIVNTGSYTWRKKERPCPIYIKNNWLIPNNPIKTLESKQQLMYKLKMNEIWQADYYNKIAQESLFIQNARNKGEAVEDCREFIENYSKLKQAKTYIKAMAEMLTGE